MSYSMHDKLSITFGNSINGSENFENYRAYTKYLFVMEQNVFILFKDDSLCLILNSNVFIFKDIQEFLSNVKSLKKTYPKAFKDLFQKIKEELNDN